MTATTFSDIREIYGISDRVRSVVFSEHQAKVAEWLDICRYPKIKANAKKGLPKLWAWLKANSVDDFDPQTFNWAVLDLPMKQKQAVECIVAIWRAL